MGFLKWSDRVPIRGNETERINMNTYDFYELLRKAKDIDSLEAAYLEIHQNFLDGKISYVDYIDLTRYYNFILRVKF